MVLRPALAALLILAAALPARAADLPPELAGLEKEGERWFREAGRTALSATGRAEARKKSYASLSRAAEILVRHGDANPSDRERIAARLADAIAMNWWLARESPGGLLDLAGPAAIPGAPPTASPATPGTRNPFDEAPSNPSAGVPAPARPASIEEAFRGAEAWTKANPSDLPGVQSRWLGVLTAFPDQSSHALYRQAAEGAGRAYEALKEVYRRIRGDDPDSAKTTEVPEIARLLIVLGPELGSQDSAVRERCARTLGHLGSGEAVALLGKAMKKEKVLQTLDAMGEALAAIGGRRAVEALRALRDEPELGGRALEWLAKAAPRNAVDGALATRAMGTFATARDPALATRAVEALLAMGPEGLPGLVEALSTQDADARLRIIAAVAATKVPWVARPLANFLLADENPGPKASREAAYAAIKSLGMDAVPHLFPALRNPRTQYWTGTLLREMTGQNLPGGRPQDWVDWWKKDHPGWKEESEK